MTAQWKEFQESHLIISILWWRNCYSLYSKKGSAWLSDTSTVVPRKHVSGGGAFMGGESGGSIFNLRSFWRVASSSVISSWRRRDFTSLSFAEVAIVVHKGNLLLLAVGSVLQKEVWCALWEPGRWQLTVSPCDMCPPMWSDMWWERHAWRGRLLLCW